MAIDESIPVKEGFCDQCTAISTEQTPGDISTSSGTGRQFYGHADPCPVCGAVTRTLWFTFVDLPLIPLGSYRYKTAAEEVLNKRFWCRKTSFNWLQVIKTWIIGFVILAALIGAGFAWHAYKNR